MIQRILIIIALVGAVAGVACVDMSAPSNGPASISLLLAPYPSVVLGDTMRDTTGAVAPLALVAYDGSGKVIPNASPSFFITDSDAVAHLDAAGHLVGDRFGIVHIIGQIGNLQTPVVPIFVTVAPTSIVPSGTVDTLGAPFGTDSTTRGQTTLTVLMTGASDSAAAGYIVHWSLGYVPASLPGKQAVYLGDASAKPTTVDTTASTGQAIMRLYVVTPYLNDSILATPNGVDTAVVFATATYRGAMVPGSPIKFVVPIKLGTILQ